MSRVEVGLGHELVAGREADADRAQRRARGVRLHDDQRRQVEVMRPAEQLAGAGGLVASAFAASRALALEARL